MSQKEQYKQLWRMNCEQLTEHNIIVEKKDAEIDALRKRLERLDVARSGTIESSSFRDLRPTSSDGPQHRGKAPQ